MRDDRNVPPAARAPVDPVLPDTVVSSHPMKRRELIKTIAASAIALPMVGSIAACTPDSRKLPVLDGKQGSAGAVDAAGLPLTGPRGTPSDPDLLNPKITWDLQLTAAELTTLSALCDMVIPADAVSPAASAVGVPAYINEYVSAPPERYQRALVQVRGGLIWINVESAKRFGNRFEALTNEQRTAICDDICYAKRATPEFQQAAHFFDRVRDLTAEGFYTTDAGMKDIGYVGNVALASFDGPPPEVLKHLGLA
ncbi:MAG: gluconate 2-dehydrogenase subunit 3 family protein [Gemmatimonadota bacterium]